MKIGLFNRKWIECDGEFVGVSLGLDYAAEHECGIKDIRSDFGITKSTIEKRMLGIKTIEVPLFGVAIRTIHKNPTSFFEKDGMYILGYTGGNPEFLKSLFKTEKTRLKMSKEGFVGLWDSRSFALVSKDKDRMEALRDAFAENNMAIFLGTSEALNSGDGLNLCIVSKMPRKVLNDMDESDRKAHQLRIDVDKLGIEDRLLKAKKRYYALSPTRRGDRIKFWLNPCEHQLYNYGWYTVEELDQWIANEGPVMKEGEKV